MKKTIIITSIFLFCVLSVFGQAKKEIKEKIRTLKIAYLSNQLNLTSNEAERFWPIYNAYDKEQHLLRIKFRLEIRKAIKEKGNIDMLSEEKAENLLLLKLKNDKKIYESKKDFINKIQKVISYKKIIKLQLAEIEFGRKIMNKYKKGNSNKRNK
ncbi:MAG: sensor of ECF-type sigma factor [Polaribacter sp.]|nr:sensor of ECF-type sigma factor [Polaribacter sp.]